MQLQRVHFRFRERTFHSTKGSRNEAGPQTENKISPEFSTRVLGGPRFGVSAMDPECIKVQLHSHARAGRAPFTLSRLLEQYRLRF
jgi:hypothetical protein